MRSAFVDGLEISGMRQEKVEKNQINIYFTINDAEYFLAIMTNGDRIFRPFMVYHTTTDYCPFCQRKSYIAYCSKLSGQRSFLFERLITFPNLRLSWLYIPFEVGGN